MIIALSGQSQRGQNIQKISDDIIVLCNRAVVGSKVKNRAKPQCKWKHVLRVSCTRIYTFLGWCTFVQR